VSSNKPLANRDFLRRVRDYLPMDAGVWDMDGTGLPSLSIPADELTDNLFYQFDSDSMAAVSHAIEDLALDEANGFLLASFQDTRHFEPHRERYWQIASTIDEVQILTAGSKPRRSGRLQFKAIDNTIVIAYWIVLYQGRRAQAMVISRQINDSEIIEDKQFAGFYTFDPRIINRTRQDITEALAGRLTVLREYDRLSAIDQAAKQIRLELSRAKTVLEAALGKCQANGQPGPLRHFFGEWDRTIQDLGQMKDRLTTLLAPSQTKAGHD
jgi:DICT domain-containing protein